MGLVQINEDGEIEIWDADAPNEKVPSITGAWRKPATPEERIAALEELVVKLVRAIRQFAE